ncbi:Conserved_hypothetical protein [Hexamita inflata]|uniref:Uncharacterized protein n=1 Tax=Hexamita inflata TaxID=28002 RepID=A0AA86N9P2_9EUKA|nr:Conserved hypothetical protein [Hexamita inflata]
MINNITLYDRILCAIFLSIAFIIYNIRSFQLQTKYARHRRIYIILNVLLSASTIITLDCAIIMMNAKIGLSAIILYTLLCILSTLQFVLKPITKIANIMIQFIIDSDQQTELEQQLDKRFSSGGWKQMVNDAGYDEEIYKLKTNTFNILRRTSDDPQKFENEREELLQNVIQDFIYQSINLARAQEHLHKFEDKAFNQAYLSVPEGRLVMNLKQQLENVVEEQEKLEQFTSLKDCLNWKKINSKLATFFFIQLIFSLFDALLGLTDMIQFFELCGIEMPNMDHWLFFVPNQIYELLTPLKTGLGFLISIILVLLIQSITDYQKYHLAKEKSKFLWLAQKSTVFWSNSCRSQHNNIFNVQQVVHKLILTFLKFFEGFVGIILTDYSTMYIQEAQTVTQAMPRIVLCILLVIQAFDSKYFSLLIQLPVYRFKTCKFFTALFKILIDLLYMLNCIFTGFFSQILFPFELVSAMFGFHNSKTKELLTRMDLEELEMRSSRSNKAVKTPLLRLCKNLSILAFEATLMIGNIDNLSIILLSLIGVCAAYDIMFFFLSWKYNKRLLSKKKLFVFELIDNVERFCMLEPKTEQTSIWQNFVIGEKIMKYSAIPYIGSLIGCITNYLNGPPLIVSGEIQEPLPYWLNYLHLGSFMVFVVLFGLNNIYYIIPLVIWVILFVLDTWEEAEDYLADESSIIKQTIFKEKETEDEQKERVIKSWFLQEIEDKDVEQLERKFCFKKGYEPDETQFLASATNLVTM